MNAPGPETPFSHQRMDVPFPLFSLPTELTRLKIGLKHCKWSSLNAPTIEALLVIQVRRNPVSHFRPSSHLGYINWPLKLKVEKFGEKNWLNRLQMVQVECSRH